MKIGVMLRAIDEKQGIGIYTRNLMDTLIPMDRQNSYVLFHRNPEFLGRYAQYGNVTERLVRAPGKALWDQVMIPLAAKREGVDVIFHTKFTVPLLTSCKTIMSIHGASWFVHPELYGGIDIAYIRVFMPLYCRKSAAILSNSELTTEDFIRILGVSREKIHTVRLGVHERFQVISDRGRLEEARRKYNLPAKYILSVIKHDPRKNFANLIAAFRLCRKKMPCKLVVIGSGCDKYRKEYALDSDGAADDVLFLGWVDQENLPAIYNMAECLFFPSVYEEFGLPTCEAMACGCPVVVSKTGALPELSGNAGIHVDPFNPAEMAQALERMLGNRAFRDKYAARALARAKMFSWTRCAEETLAVLNGLAASSKRAALSCHETLMEGRGLLGALEPWRKGGRDHTDDAQAGKPALPTAVEQPSQAAPDGTAPEARGPREIS